MADNPNQPQSGLQFRPPNRGNAMEQRESQKRSEALQEVTSRLGGLQNRSPVDFSDGIPVIDEGQPEQVEQEQLAPPPQQAPAPVKKAAPKKPQNYEHPTIGKLLKNFGIKQQTYYDVELVASQGEDPIKYKMSQIPDEISLWAVQDAQFQIPLKGETASVSWYQCLVTSAAVVAIDDEPIYKIFGIKPNKEEEAALAADPFDVSIRMRQISGRTLGDILWKKTRGVVDKLNEFYLGGILNENQVTSTYDRDLDKKERYVCPIDRCPVVYIEGPLPEDETYFCKKHGQPMIMAARLKEELDLPLP